jgi:hypothetical protein
MLAAVQGAEWAQPWFERRLRPIKNLEALVGHLNQVALGSPELANAWLNAWLADRSPYGTNLTLPGESWLTTLPDGFTVDGALSANGSGIRELPRGLSVDAQLYLCHTPLTTVPADLDVGGLVLEGARIASLPPNLKIRGSLGLVRTPIRELPAGLQVAHNLELTDSLIERLGPGLRVAGSLDLRGCRYWNGQVPHDAEIGSLHTEQHPPLRGYTFNPGIPMAEWRALHPHGERA